MDLASDKVGEWLGLTAQQMDVLYCIYRLGSGGSRASPKNIQAEYRKLRGKYLMKANLFKLLKILKNIGCISKKGYGNYIVDFKGLNRLVDKRRHRFEEESKQFHRVAEDMEAYFSELASESERPLVRYYGYSETFNQLVERLPKSTTYYATTRFPMESYSYDLAKRLKVDEYYGAILKNIVEDGKVNVHYLTSLDLPYLLKQHLRAGYDFKQAVRGCVGAVNTLENHVEDNPGKNIYILKEPGLDILLLEKNKPPEDFFIFTRDEKRLITGSVYIKSKTTAQTVRKQFIDTCGRATKITPENKKELFKKLRDEAKQLSEKEVD